MLKNTKFKTVLFTAVSAALLSACGGGGGSSPSTELVNNATSARSVIDKVAALKQTEELTAADAAAVDAVSNAYESLSDASKQLVGKDTLDRLKAAQEAVKTTAGGSQSADNSVIQAADSAVNEVKSKIAALPDSAKDVDEQALTEAQQAFNALSEQQKTLITTAEKSKLDKLSDQLVTDHSPLPALNLTTPLHTDFIQSAAAQQNNPNVQLRKIDGQNDFTRNQGGLISTLAFNQNSEVKLDGVIISNNTAVGGATQVNFTTPHSMIAKVLSKGISESDISAHTGLSAGSKFATGTASFDEELKKVYEDLEAAKKENDQEKINKLQPVYDRYMALRPQLAEAVEVVAADIPYIRKDKNGLVFDTKFDGVYIVQFADGTHIKLHDPAAAGWKYQTFAYYKDPKNGVIHGYQTLGDETSFGSLPNVGTATYNGLSTAYLVEGNTQRQLTADVKAVVDFAKKGVRFETSNSHFHTVNGNVRTSTAAAAYDIKGNAAWGNVNHFSGTAQTANGLKGSLNGKFYGENAAEMGGTYGLKNDSAQLIGGYGAKRH